MLKNLLKDQKQLYLLSKEILGIKSIILLLAVILINIFLETISIGLIIPLTGVLLDPEFMQKLFSFSLFNFEMKNIFNKLNLEDRTDLIFVIFTIFLIAIILRVFFNLFTLWYAEKIKFKLSYLLSTKLFSSYIFSDYKNHLNKNSAFFFRNVSAETILFSNSFYLYLTIYNDLLLILAIFTVLLATNFFFSFISIFYFLICSLIIFLGLKNYILSLGYKRQQLSLDNSQYLRESFDLIKEIKIFKKEADFSSNFKKINKAYLNILKKRALVQGLPRNLLEIFAVFFLFFVILVSFNTGQPTINIISYLSLFVFSSYRILASLNKGISSFQSILFSRPAVNLIFQEIKNIENNSNNRKDKKIENLSFKNKLNFTNITFGYKEKNIFENFNFEIKKNSFNSIIGKSGSGKSTLVNIILGLIMPQAGNIEIDKKKISMNDYKYINKNFGYVAQNFVLQDKNIKENIAFGVKDENINLDKIRNIISMVELEEFVKNLPQGLDTIIGERGKNISGGQMQRIAIARSLYHEPDLLILDESTNSLDSETEEKILKMIKKNLKKQTIIFISHKDNAKYFSDNLIKI